MTGEAVVLGLRSAKLPSRALARLIDAVVQVIAWIITVMIAIAVAGNADEAAIAAIMLSIFVFYAVVLPVVVETLSKGRSLGKLALGLRVVRTDGGPVRFRHALVRGLVGVVDFGLSGVPAVVTSLISSEGKRLGDIFAGTLVIRERVPAAARAHSALPQVPPQLLHAMGADLVAMDLSAVPDPLWLAIRQYLGRIEQLDPAVAFGMAQRLASDLTAHIGRAIPYGVSPAMYLGAVLTERQRREWARAAAYPQPYQPHQPYQPAQYQQPQPVTAPAPTPTPAPGPQPLPREPGPAPAAGGFAPPA